VRFETPTSACRKTFPSSASTTSALRHITPPGSPPFARPLRDMGETAACVLLQRIQGLKDHPKSIAVTPELIVRETTAAPNVELAVLA